MASKDTAKSSVSQTPGCITSLPLEGSQSSTCDIIKPNQRVFYCFFSCKVSLSSTQFTLH